MSTTDLALPLAAHWERLRAAAQDSKAKNTRASYATYWGLFAEWCGKHQLPALPVAPETLCLYLSDLVVRCKISTLQKALAAIRSKHLDWAMQTLPEAQVAHYVPPTRDPGVRTILQGFSRQKGTARTKKAPLFPHDLRGIFLGLDSDRPADIRDRALLLVGFAAALRRSEIAAMQVEHLSFDQRALVITIPRSKTDQEGQGQQVAILRGGALCPVRALETWLKVGGIAQGWVWRRVHKSGSIGQHPLQGRIIALIVKKHAALIGKDPATFAGHSLRRGFATAATLVGASPQRIMKTTRHRSLSSLGEYIDAGELYDNASGMLGL